MAKMMDMTVNVERASLPSKAEVWVTVMSRIVNDNSSIEEKEELEEGVATIDDAVAIANAVADEYETKFLNDPALSKTVGFVPGDHDALSIVATRFAIETIMEAVNCLMTCDDSIEFAKRQVKIARKLQHIADSLVRMEPLQTSQDGRGFLKIPVEGLTPGGVCERATIELSALVGYAGDKDAIKKLINRLTSLSRKPFMNELDLWAVAIQLSKNKAAADAANPTSYFPADLMNHPAIVNAKEQTIQPVPEPLASHLAHIKHVLTQAADSIELMPVPACRDMELVQRLRFATHYFSGLELPEIPTSVGGGENIDGIDLVSVDGMDAHQVMIKAASLLRGVYGSSSAASEVSQVIYRLLRLGNRGAVILPLEIWEKIRMTTNEAAEQIRKIDKPGQLQNGPAYWENLANELVEFYCR